jgi:hypothetical protein
LFTFVAQFIHQNLNPKHFEELFRFIFLKAGRKDKQWAFIDKSFLKYNALAMENVHRARFSRE